MIHSRFITIDNERMPVGFPAGTLSCVEQIQMEGQHGFELLFHGREDVLHLFPTGTSYIMNSPFIQVSLLPNKLMHSHCIMLRTMSYGV